MNKKINLKGDGFFFILLMLSLFMYSRVLIKEQPGKPIGFKNNNIFFIRITGDINEPGIYSFFEPVDLYKLIKAGGGLKDKGRTNRPLMDLHLTSGNWVIVKKKDDGWILTRKEIPAFYKITLGIPIDINRESIEGLTAIPGIGNTLATRIEKERNRRNGFRDLSEIKRISGIGDAIYKKIAKYITLK